MIRDQIEQIRQLFETGGSDTAGQDLIEQIVAGSDADSFDDAFSQVTSLADQCLRQMDTLKKVYDTVVSLNGKCQNLTDLLQNTRDILCIMNDSTDELAKDVAQLIERIDVQLTEPDAQFNPDISSECETVKLALKTKDQVETKAAKKSLLKKSSSVNDTEDGLLAELDRIDTELTKSSQARKQALQNLYANRPAFATEDKEAIDLFDDVVIFGKWDRITNKRNEFNCEIAKERLSEKEYKAKQMVDSMYHADEEITDELLDEIEDIDKDELPTGNDMLDELDKIEALFIG